jgi:hypothetical protein
MLLIDAESERDIVVSTITRIMDFSSSGGLESRHRLRKMKKERSRTRVKTRVRDPQGV